MHSSGASSERGTSVAIVIAILTLLLFAATFYYAVQTRFMVREMGRQRDTMVEQVSELRTQREDAVRAELERYRRQIVGIRSAVVAEIRQIMEWDSRPTGYRTSLHVAIDVSMARG